MLQPFDNGVILPNMFAYTIYFLAVIVVSLVIFSYNLRLKEIEKSIKAHDESIGNLGHDMSHVLDDVHAIDEFLSGATEDEPPDPSKQTVN